MTACPVWSYHPIEDRKRDENHDAPYPAARKLDKQPQGGQHEQDSPETAHQRVLVEQEEPQQERGHEAQTVEPLTIKQPKHQQLYCREQERDDDGSHPGIKEELRREASQQVGDATRVADDVPHIVAVEEEQLELLLIVQVVRVRQSEEEEDRRTEENRT